MLWPFGSCQSNSCHSEEWSPRSIPNVSSKIFFSNLRVQSPYLNSEARLQQQSETKIVKLFSYFPCRIIFFPDSVRILAIIFLKLNVACLKLLIFCYKKPQTTSIFSFLS